MLEDKMFLADVQQRRRGKRPPKKALKHRNTGIWTGKQDLLMLVSPKADKICKTHLTLDV